MDNKFEMKGNERAREINEAHKITHQRLPSQITIASKKKTQ